MFKEICKWLFGAEEQPNKPRIKSRSEFVFDLINRQRRDLIISGVSPSKIKISEDMLSCLEENPAFLSLDRLMGMELEVIEEKDHHIEVV